MHGRAGSVYLLLMRGVHVGGVILSVGLIAGLLTVVGQGAHAASAVAGKPCKVAGQEATDARGRTLLCKKNRKGRLVWTVKKGGGPSPTPPQAPYMWWGTWADGWKQVAPAPPCPKDLSTLFTRLPFDLDDVTGIVRPGHQGDSGYKPHSHIRYSESDADGRQVIYAPADGWLYTAARYREAFTPGNDQVILSFFTECGVMWGFDHLRDGQLSPAMAAAVANVPVRDMDTQGTNVTPVWVKAGDVLATAVGATNCEVGRPLCIPSGGPNYFVDFGVYDPRQLNEAALSDPSFLTGPNVGAYEGIAVCWIDLFPASKAAIEAKALGESDYC